MRRTKEEAEITRQEIVKAGLRAFANKGYAAARLEDVAEEAGVTRGAIYWHFENKEDLYIQLMEQTLERYKRQVHRALEIEGSPLTKIRTLLRDLFVMLEDDEDYRAAYTTFLFRPTQTSETRDQLDRVFAFMGELGRTLRTLIQEGIEVGEVDPSTDPFVASVALVSYINGVELSWLVAPESFSVKRVADDLAEFILKGVLKDNSEGGDKEKGVCTTQGGKTK